MTFSKGWLQEQIKSAEKTISSWSQEKQHIMLRPDLDVQNEKETIINLGW